MSEQGGHLEAFLDCAEWREWSERRHDRVVSAAAPLVAEVDDWADDEPDDVAVKVRLGDLRRLREALT